jgi:tRNA threonylcarbamoyladenosine biosynthesis protein TsaB
MLKLFSEKNKDMKLLAIDTATEACSAALYINGTISERYELAPREHTKLILPMIDSLMAEVKIEAQDLDVLAFGRGPGSFTGVRIATGITQGIAFAANLRIVPVSTLAAIAQDCLEKTDNDCIFTAVDARMNEIYWAVYQRNPENIVELSSQESVGPVTNIDCLGHKGFGIGSGWNIHESKLKAQLADSVIGYDANYLPKASVIARLGVYGFNNNQAVSVEQAMPVYLRDKVAKKESERI